eukprot:2261152-Rhodomonas_salina.1
MKERGVAIIWGGGVAGWRVRSGQGLRPERFDPQKKQKKNLGYGAAKAGTEAGVWWYQRRVEELHPLVFLQNNAHIARDASWKAEKGCPPPRAPLGCGADFPPSLPTSLPPSPRRARGDSGREFSTAQRPRSPIFLRAAYAMSGTDIPYGDIPLRASYAIAGTDIPYGDIPPRASYAMPVLTSHIVLLPYYAMSGIGISHGVCLPERVLCDARY